jgi:hypothetical protein
MQKNKRQGNDEDKKTPLNKAGLVNYHYINILTHPGY